MTSIMGLSLPNIGAPKQRDIVSPKNIALGTIAAGGLAAGGIIGKIKGHPMIGLGIGAAIAATALGAALIGNASSSQRDGYCDYYGDADCDYPGVDPRPYPGGYDPYPYDNPNYDGGYTDRDGDGGREDYPDTGYYPGGGTSRGDGY
ncbi:MAG: hypothetical protein JWM86_780 [Thermoleophilia bacterium]|nr:hypothetical protein [Thermoleophilia bacterium]